MKGFKVKSRNILFASIFWLSDVHLYSFFWISRGKDKGNFFYSYLNGVKNRKEESDVIKEINNCFETKESSRLISIPHCIPL